MILLFKYILDSKNKYANWKETSWFATTERFFDFGLTILFWYIYIYMGTGLTVYKLGIEKLHKLNPSHTK